MAKLYRCAICGFTTDWLRLLILHLVEDHGELPDVVPARHVRGVWRRYRILRSAGLILVERGEVK